MESIFQIDDNIIHDVLGKGIVTDVAAYEGNIYLGVWFENDPVDKIRMFTEDSIKPHLI